MVPPSTTLKTVTTWRRSHVGIPGMTGGNTWPSPSYERSTLGHSPILRVTDEGYFSGTQTS
jgi:hypothetical protein